MGEAQETQERPGNIERIERIVMALKEADRMLMRLYDPDARCPEPRDDWEKEKMATGIIRNIHQIISQSLEELEYLQYSIARQIQDLEAIAETCNCCEAE